MPDMLRVDQMAGLRVHIRWCWNSIDSVACSTCCYRLIDGLAFLDWLADLVVSHREYSVMKAAQNLAAALFCASVCTAALPSNHLRRRPARTAAVDSDPQQVFGVLLGQMEAT